MRRQLVNTVIAIILVCGTLFGLSSQAVMAQSGAILDQAQLNGNSGVADYYFAQTFTAGITGDLIRIDLNAFMNTGQSSANSSNIPLEVRSVDSHGVPTANVLATGLLPIVTDEAATWVSVPLTPAVPVVAGTKYAFVMREASITTFFKSSFSNPYAGGSTFDTYPTPDQWRERLPIDLTFRTYVVPVVPTIHHSQSIDVIAAPPSVVENTLESDQFIRVFPEQLYYTVPKAITVNGTTIPAGTRVNVYYIHADRVGSSTTASVKLTGSVSFDTNVLAVLTDANALKNTHTTLGNSSTAYSSSPDQGSESGDTVTVTNQYQVTMTFNLWTGADDVRVITLAQ